MEKTSKVKQVKENMRQWDSKQYGKFYVHEIYFENGDAGDFSSTAEKCNKFTVGEETTYTIEKGSGENNDKIKPVSEKPFKKGNGYNSQPPELKAASYAASYTKDLVVSGSIPIDKFKEYFEKIYDLMANKIK